jgi:glycosyltransferase involved in cell wall biosynthesis
VFSTPEELVSAMARLAGDPGYRDRLGRAGRRAFQERWSEQVVVPKYLEIVRQAAERKREGTILERLTPRQRP